MAIDRRSFVGRMALALGALGQTNPLRAAAEKNASASTPEQPRSRGYIRPNTIEVIHQTFDLVVVGGGISGTCAAISAARNGSKVALVHERSTLGGNSSSEVRLYPEDTCSRSTWIKEAGILEEISTEERVRNWEPYQEALMNSQWDLVLYEWAKREKNLTLFLNTTMREVEMLDEAHILAIHGAQLGTEREFILEAPLFVDSSGDGVLAYRAGADFRWGREAQSEYHEPTAPPKASDKLMGSTLFFRARDTGRPIHFKKPDWAAEFATEQDLISRNHGSIEGGYWWIEVGFPMHQIKDNEAIRDEALRQLMGVWDHIKNRCTHDGVRERAANYALEFVGFWPYKRESRRILGDYILLEKDVRNPSRHPDDLAYGNWEIDIHTPGGILDRHDPPYPPRMESNFAAICTIPYGIPLRSCYSRNIHNLLTAGRPISASYIAFSSSRVLPTGAIVGQGVGVAAGLCKKYRCDPKTVAAKHANELQQILLRQDASIPGVENTDTNDLARKAKVIASSDAGLQFPEPNGFRFANYPLGQVLPISTDRLETIELLLESKSNTPQKIHLSLREVKHVWDMRPSRVIATATATVPPNSRGYISFPLHARTEPNRLYFVYMDANPEIAWAHFQEKAGEASRIPVGTTAASLPSGDDWRPLTKGQAFALKVAPEQHPYTAQNIVRGTNRPDMWTNIFISDPAQALPAWVELQFPHPVEFNQVQITFDTDTNRRVRLPLFRYPECVKEYEITIPEGSAWKTIAEEKDNYSRRRVHTVEATKSDRLRINILKTNGSSSARIYEVRVYNEPKQSRQVT